MAPPWQAEGMTLEDLGNVGEFVGGLAVIITLDYLALELCINTRT